MPLLLVGINHRTAGLEIRERFALSRERGEEMLTGLAQYVPYAAVLPTCNRTEVYVTAHNTAVGAQHLQRFMADWSGIPAGEIGGYLYTLEQWDAVRHLFHVAAGLESMVQVEEQILGQVRSAMEAADGRGALDAVLRACFRRALRAGRRVRSETGISRNAVSVSSVAVRLARDAFGGLQGLRVLVISAGEAGKLATRSLVAQGVGRLQVTSRSFERAKALAERMGGEPLPWRDLDRALATTDLVITATGATERVLDTDRVARTAGGRPLVMIDLGVPRDIDPDAGDLPGVHLYNLDDVQRYAQTNLQLRALEVEKAEALLSAEVGRFQEWWEQREIVPTIAALRDQADGIREEELRRTLSRLPELTDAERARIEAMTKAIVKKILHRPLTHMKERRDGDGAVEAVRELFGLHHTNHRQPAVAKPRRDHVAQAPPPAAPTSAGVEAGR